MRCSPWRTIAEVAVCFGQVSGLGRLVNGGRGQPGFFGSEAVSPIRVGVSGLGVW